VVSRSTGRAVTTPSAPSSPTPQGSSPPRLGVYRLHQQLIGVRRRHRWLHHARATPLQLTNTQLAYQAGTTGSDCWWPSTSRTPRWTCRPLVPPPSRPTCTRSTTKTCVGGSTRTAGPSSPQGVRGAPAPRDPPDDPVLFLEVTVADPSEVEARLQVTGEERHGYRDASRGLRRWRGVVGVHRRAAAGRRRGCGFRSFSAAGR
jgi:hypothetical protein